MKELLAVSLPTGSQLAVFLELSQTIQHLIEALLQQDGDLIASSLSPSSLQDIDRKELWAIQRVIPNPSPGSALSDDQLSLLQENDRLLNFKAKLSDVLPQSADKSSSRAFSDFHSAQHLHSPMLRLVYLPACLELSFQHIPLVPENFSLAWFIGPKLTCEEIIEAVLDELGITRTVTQGTKAAVIQYVLQTSATKGKGAQQVASDLLIGDVLAQNRIAGPPFAITLTLSKNWFDKIGGTLSGSVTDRFKRPSLQTTLATPIEEDGGDETLKQAAHTHRASGMFGLWATSPPDIAPGASSRTSILETSRLSTFFEGWTSPPAAAPAKEKRTRMVSEPKSVIAPAGLGIETDVLSLATRAEELDSRFEILIQDLNIKGPQAEVMRALPDDRKRYLLAQHQSSVKSALNATKSGDDVDAGVLAGLKRFSFAAIGSTWTGIEPSSESPPSILEQTFDRSKHAKVNSVDSISPAMPTQTGWSSWFNATSASDEHMSPAWFVATMRNPKTPRKTLVKHLIALRVRLSTEKLTWITDYFQNEGLPALLTCLERAAQHRRSIKQGESDQYDTALAIECTRCLRVILNTEHGFAKVVASQALVNQVVFCLEYTSYKLKTHVTEVLAALCVLSSDGHEAVMSGLADLRVVTKEKYRFANLLGSLCVDNLFEEQQVPVFEEDEAVLLDYRVAVFAFINALVSVPAETEVRVQLREEFQRRGLNEVIVALKYCDPSDALLKQFELYAEEADDDVTEMQNQVIGLHRDDSAESAWRELQKLAQDHSNLYPVLLETVKKYTLIFERDIEESVRDDLLTILDRFIEHAAHLDNFDDSWKSCMRQYLASIEHIVGQQAVVPSTSVADSANVPTSFLNEMSNLRETVEKLSDERAFLRNELAERAAESNTFRALPARVAQSSLDERHQQDSSTSSDSFTGVIQRLVQKEKQVLLLQQEVDRFTNGASRSEDAEGAKRERAEQTRRWTNLLEEIGSLRQKVAENEGIINVRDKEVKFLKRTMESVYVRFNANQPSSASIGSASIGQDSPDDAAELAERSIAALEERESSIARLTMEVSKLKEQLRRAQSVPAQTLRITPAQIGELLQSKGQLRAAPLPPAEASKSESDRPAVRQAASASNSDVSIPAPPPPPPQTRPAFLASIKAIREDKESESSSPPPPPPAPPALLKSIKSLSKDRPSNVPLPPIPPAIQTRVVHRRPTVVKPSIKLKPLHWNKVDINPNQATIWNASFTDLEIDLSELQRAFAAAPAPSAIRSVSSTPEVSQVKTLLDGSRANNIEMMMRKSKMSPATIKNAILAVDDSRLSLEFLKALKQNAPNNKEISALNAFKGDTQALSTSDQFIRQLHTVPRLTERIGCLMYRARFELDIEELRPELNIIKSAIAEIKASTTFQQLLAIVLQVGNTLNASTFRGNATAFKLDALLKLRETKATNASGTNQTLLHFIVRQLMKNNPGLLDFADKMPHLDAASKSSFATLRDTSQKLAGGLKMAAEEVIEAGKISSPVSVDRFASVMKTFCHQANPAINALQVFITDLNTESRQLIEYFGEDETTFRLEDLFSTLVSFAASLQRAKCDLEEQDLRKARMAQPSRRTSAQTKTHQQTLRLPVAFVTDGRRSIGKGDFEEAMRDLRNGTSIIKRQRTQSKPRPLSPPFRSSFGRLSTLALDLPTNCHPAYVFLFPVTLHFMVEQTFVLSPKLGALFLAYTSACLHCWLFFVLITQNRGPDDDESVHSALGETIRSVAKLWNSIVAVISIYGVYSIHKNRIEPIRALALVSLADLALSSMSILTFGLLSFSPSLAAHFSKSLCSALTSGERSAFQSNDHLTTWTGSLGIDGLEVCEERWRVFGLLLLTLASVIVTVQAHFVNLTWQFYRHLLRKRSLLGHLDVPLLSHQSRPRSHTYHASTHNRPRLSLVTSPYSPGPASAPVFQNLSPANISTPSFRRGHMSRSSNQVLVYAPFLIDAEHLDNADLTTAAGDESPFIQLKGLALSKDTTHKDT